VTSMAGPYYMVVCRGDGGTHYIFATSRKFYLYSEAELYTQSIAISRQPLILMIG
jgi:hypothetical protein